MKFRWLPAWALAGVEGCCCKSAGWLRTDALDKLVSFIQGGDELLEKDRPGRGDDLEQVLFAYKRIIAGFVREIRHAERYVVIETGIAWIPTCRRRALFSDGRRFMDQPPREIANQDRLRGR